MTFDSNLKKTVENILAVKMTEPMRKQASLTPKLGGLGFRRTVDHAKFAFSASWHEALVTSKEKWDRPDGVPEEYASQSVNRGAKGSRLDSSVEAVVARGEGGNESSGVRLGQASKALSLPRLVGFLHLHHHLSVHCFVEPKRGC